MSLLKQTIRLVIILVSLLALGKLVSANPAMAMPSGNTNDATNFASCFEETSSQFGYILKIIGPKHPASSCKDYIKDLNKKTGSKINYDNDLHASHCYIFEGKPAQPVEINCTEAYSRSTNNRTGSQSIKDFTNQNGGPTTVSGEPSSPANSTAGGVINSSGGQSDSCPSAGSCETNKPKETPINDTTLGQGHCAEGELQLSIVVSNGSDCIQADQAGNNNPIFRYLRAIIQFLTAGVGVVIVLMIIISGIQYITSTGNPQSTASAKGRLTNAIIALLLFIFMFAILNYLVPGGLLR